MKAFGKKLEKSLLVLFLLLIPTQLGKHFWPSWSGVLGMRIDYLAPVIYLVDIVWLGWLMVRCLTANYQFSLKKYLTFENFICLAVIGLNILIATSREVALYKWIRIGQWWISYRILKNQRLEIKKYLKWIIPVWIIGESLLGWAQIVSGQNLGGLFYWLGERRFNFNTVGIAQMSVMGEGILRAYGTFSHPNSLAGFLLVSWLMFQSLLNQSFEKGEGKTKNVGYWIVWWMGLAGILISGSRIVWLLTGLILIKNLNIKKIFLIGVLVIGAGWIISWNYRLSDFLGGWDVNGLEKRLNLNIAAMEMVRKNIMLGLGAGNFLIKLPEYQRQSRFFWLQPVHNVFLLALAEIGVLGIVVCTYKFFSSGLNNLLNKNKWIWVVVLLTGMIDHYWLTLPQNSWLLAIFLVF